MIEHLNKLRLVVLHVGVHHGDIARLACQHSFNACSGKPAPADPADTAHTAVMFPDGPHQHCGSVRRVVIRKNDFPIIAGE